MVSIATCRSFFFSPFCFDYYGLQRTTITDCTSQALSLIHCNRNVQKKKNSRGFSVACWHVNRLWVFSLLLWWALLFFFLSFFFFQTALYPCVECKSSTCFGLQAYYPRLKVMPQADCHSFIFDALLFVPSTHRSHHKRSSVRDIVWIELLSPEVYIYNSHSLSQIDILHNALILAVYSMHLLSLSTFTCFFTTQGRTSEIWALWQPRLCTLWLMNPFVKGSSLCRICAKPGDLQCSHTIDLMDLMLWLNIISSDHLRRFGKYK